MRRDRLRQRFPSATAGCSFRVRHCRAQRPWSRTEGHRPVTFVMTLPNDLAEAVRSDVLDLLIRFEGGYRPAGSLLLPGTSSPPPRHRTGGACHPGVDRLGARRRRAECGLRRVRRQRWLRYASCLRQVSTTTSPTPRTRPRSRPNRPHARRSDSEFPRQAELGADPRRGATMNLPLVDSPPLPSRLARPSLTTPRHERSISRGS